MTGVVAIDVGTINFAIAWLRDDGRGQPQVGYMSVCDLTGRGANGCFRNLISHLRSIEWIFVEHRPHIIIEKQMQSKHRTNVKALKMSQHVLAFFLNRHPDLVVREYPSTQKSRYLGHGLTYAQRKREAIRVVSEWLGDDPVGLDWFMALPKKDDVADCILMSRCWWSDDRGSRCSA